MFADARRELSQLELTVLSMIQKEYSKIESRTKELDIDSIKQQVDFSEQLRRRIEHNCFNGIERIKHVFESISNLFEVQSRGRMYLARSKTTRSRKFKFSDTNETFCSI